MSRLFRTSFLKGLMKEQKPRLLIDRQVNVLWSLTLAVLLFFAVLGTWLTTSSLDHIVNSKGISLPLGGVRDAFSLANGQITQLYHRTGDKISAGKVLAQVVDPERQHQYEEQRNIYQLEQQKRAFEQEKLDISLGSERSQQRLLLQQIIERLVFLSGLEKQLSEAIETYYKRGAVSLKDQKLHLETLKKQYQIYINSLKKLQKNGFASNTTLLDRLSGYESILNSFSEIERQGYKSLLDNNLSLNELGRIRDDISKTKIEKLKTELELALIEKKYLIEVATLALNETKERKSLLSKERELWRNSLLIAPYDGKLLSFIPGIGHILKTGDTFAIIELISQKPKLLLSISPHAKKGFIELNINGVSSIHTLDKLKRDDFYQQIAKSISAQFDKSEFEFSIEKSGLVIASHKKDSVNKIEIVTNQLKDNENIPVFAEINTLGDNWQQTEEINLSIVTERHAKLLKIGMPISLLSSHQSRWLDDSVNGEIIQISEYPMTALEIENLIGSKLIASKISGKQEGYVVLSNLKSSGNGKKPIMPTATRTENKFIVGKKAPITLIIPVIENLFSE